MSARRNPSRRRLQSANATKMRGHANRSAPVASHSSGGASARNRRGLSAARSTGRKPHVARIARPARQPVVGFVRHQELRRSRVTQHHRARGANSLHQRCISARPAIFSQQRTRRARPARHVNTTLHRQWNSTKWTALTTQNRFSRCVCFPHRALRIQVRECIQLRLQLFDPPQIMLSHLLRRNFFAPDFLRQRCKR